ncbi:MAG: hypothetical protein AB7O32_06670 [Vicinamibacterales bacterium]
MDTPLNLTAERGPSIWDTPSPAPVRWSLVSLAVGAAMTAAGYRQPGRRWLFAMGLGGLALGLIAAVPVDAWRSRARVREADRRDDPLDEAIEDSFPASDPPALTEPAAPAPTLT